MANVKISALPTWTGSVTDQRWFVMNNNGETETFKYQGYASQILPSNGASSVRSQYFASTQNDSPYGVLIGGLNTNDISSTGNYNAIIAGEGNTITAGEDNGIFVAKNSTIGSSSSYSAIIGGRTHTVNNQFGFIGGGAQNTAGYLSATIAGFNLNASNQSHIVGGENNTASNNYGGIWGGTGNGCSSGAYSSIYNSQSSTINSSGTRNAILSSNNSTITGAKQNAVMIGTSGRTASQDYATHIENLVIFNYSNLNYADDTAAAAGGVVLGQVYHNSGALRVRIV